MPKLQNRRDRKAAYLNHCIYCRQFGGGLEAIRGSCDKWNLMRLLEDAAVTQANFETVACGRQTMVAGIRLSTSISQLRCGGQIFLSQRRQHT